MRTFTKRKSLLTFLSCFLFQILLSLSFEIFLLCSFGILLSLFSSLLFFYFLLSSYSVFFSLFSFLFKFNFMRCKFICRVCLVPLFVKEELILFLLLWQQPKTQPQLFFLFFMTLSRFFYFYFFFKFLFCNYLLLFS